MANSEEKSTDCMKRLSDCMPRNSEELAAWVNEMYLETRSFNRCKSPIEHEFLHYFYKFVREDIKVSNQEWCRTEIGNFCLDFVITSGKRRIGVECDGKDYHDPIRDKERDEAIVRAGFLDCIYRSPGNSLWYHGYDVIDLLRMREPQLFSQRGNIVLEGMLYDGIVREDEKFETSILRVKRRKLTFDDPEFMEGDEPSYKPDGRVLLNWTEK
jgi:very-short-patch-repair endonuclease